MPIKFENLKGKVYGRLTVKNRISRAKRRDVNRAWKCKCFCGKMIEVSSWDLLNERAKSCGCLLDEGRKIGFNTKHGEYGTLHYNLWRSAKRRSKLKKVHFSLSLGDVPQVPDHCPILGMKLFKNTSQGPSENSPTLDRINPQLGYIPGNVQVISMKANAIKNNATSEEIMLVAKHMEEHEKRCSRDKSITTRND